MVFNDSFKLNMRRASCNVNRVFKHHSLEEFENTGLFLRLGRPYPGGIWKRRIISTVRPTLPRRNLKTQDYFYG